MEVVADEEKTKGRRQFKCHNCSKPFSEASDFIGNRRKQTDRFAQWIVEQVLHSDIHNVALQNDLTDEEVWKGGAIHE